MQNQPHTGQRERVKLDRMEYGSTSLLRNWIGLLHLAHHRSRSTLDYQRFQIYQAGLVIEHLEQLEISLPGMRILDLGCGLGGYSHVMTQIGADVISLDFRQPQMHLCKTFVVADALHTSFSNESFPFVFCASLIEHVPEPIGLLTEIARVLTPDGSAYLSFPPFYSPMGGHQFKPFHLLGEQLALRLTRKKKQEYATCYGDWGLCPLSIRQARRAISEAGLQIGHESTRFSPVNLASIPYFGEFLTWHVQFVVEKRRDP